MKAKWFGSLARAVREKKRSREGKEDVNEGVDGVDVLEGSWVHLLTILSTLLHF